MGNSPLVNYTRISPHYTKGRKHSIDTITIHHMAGDLSVETCGNVFQTREASSNYGVDSNGRIGMYVLECNRSWCSSNGTNDNRAITIEVADKQVNGKWVVSDKAMSALINLVTDCCQRNSIKRLVWSDNKNNRVNHINGCNMTVHKDFASTTCPADLYYKMGYIADEVNKRLSPAFNEEKVSEFVERLYRIVLGRPSDVGGKKYWIDRLKNGETGANICRGFFYSTEFNNIQSAMGDSAYVETLYNAFFGRASDPNGKEYWLGELARGKARMSLIDGFINSIEFANLCKTFGIASGSTARPTI